MNWLSMTVGAVFLICLIVGFMRGALKIIVSLAATLLTLVLVYFATPYVADAIAEYTPLDDMIKSQVVSTMANAAASQLGGGEESGGMDADSVRKVLQAAGVSEDMLAQYGITIDDIVNGNISSEDLARFGISSDVLNGLQGEEGTSMEDIITSAEIPRDVQIQAIEGADLPEIFKSLLTENNNSEMYSRLGAETFAEYVGDFLAKLILNILAFFVYIYPCYDCCPGRHICPGHCFQSPGPWHLKPDRGRNHRPWRRSDHRVDGIYRDHASLCDKLWQRNVRDDQYRSVFENVVPI